jgi:hypothetical protein
MTSTVEQTIVRGAPEPRTPCMGGGVTHVTLRDRDTRNPPAGVQTPCCVEQRGGSGSDPAVASPSMTPKAPGLPMSRSTCDMSGVTMGCGLRPPHNAGRKLQSKLVDTPRRRAVANNAVNAASGSSPSAATMPLLCTPCTPTSMVAQSN